MAINQTHWGDCHESYYVVPKLHFNKWSEKMSILNIVQNRCPPAGAAIWPKIAQKCIGSDFTQSVLTVPSHKIFQDEVLGHRVRKCSVSTWSKTEHLLFYHLILQYIYSIFDTSTNKFCVVYIKPNKSHMRCNHLTLYCISSTNKRCVQLPWQLPQFAGRWYSDSAPLN